MTYDTLLSKLRLVELIQNKLKELGLNYTLDELELNKVDDINNFIEVKLYKKTIDQQIPEILKHCYKEIKQTITVMLGDGEILIKLSTRFQYTYGGNNGIKSNHLCLVEFGKWVDYN